MSIGTPHRRRKIGTRTLAVLAASSLWVVAHGAIAADHRDAPLFGSGFGVSAGERLEAVFFNACDDPVRIVSAVTSVAGGTSEVTETNLEPGSYTITEIGPIDAVGAYGRDHFAVSVSAPRNSCTAPGARKLQAAFAVIGADGNVRDVIEPAGAHPNSCGTGPGRAFVRTGTNQAAEVAVINDCEQPHRYKFTVAPDGEAPFEVEGLLEAGAGTLVTIDRSELWVGFHSGEFDAVVPVEEPPQCRGHMSVSVFDRRDGSSSHSTVIDVRQKFLVYEDLDDL